MLLLLEPLLKLLIKLQDYEGTDSLVCTVIGNGNNLVSDYNKEKVLRIDCEMLNPGEVTISIKSHQTGTLIAETPITIRMENAGIELQEVSVTGNKKKHPVLNSYNMVPPRGFKPGDPKIGQAASIAHFCPAFAPRFRPSARPESAPLPLEAAFSCEITEIIGIFGLFFRVLAAEFCRKIPHFSVVAAH